jgi:hypothetical protein
MFKVSDHFWGIIQTCSIFTIHQTEGIPYRAKKDGGIWRLVFNNISVQPASASESATEEVIMSIQGILCKKGLPLFLDQIG